MINLESLLDILKDHGLVGVLVIVLLLLIENPDRAFKIQKIVLAPTYLLFKWGSKRYLASVIADRTTEFFKNQLSKYISDCPAVNVRVKWVSSPADPVLSANNALILRITETNDQTRNVLSATRAALPQIICPTLRSNIEPYMQTAIDLTILRSMAQQIGKHAQNIYQKFFLEPEVIENNNIEELLTKLIFLDNYGIYLTVFLQELQILNERKYALGDLSDITDEVEGLLGFLIAILDRDIHERVPLNFLTENFKVGIVLLAIQKKTEQKGAAPYMQAIDYNIKAGCESIYIVAYQWSSKFIKRLLNVIEGDDRVTVRKLSNVSYSGVDDVAVFKISDVMFLRRNVFFTDSNFLDRVKSEKLEIGNTVQGTVIDISEQFVLVDVHGLNAYITKKECSWNTVMDCKEILGVGDKQDFLIVDISQHNNRISLSLRMPQSDPWNSVELPTVGDVVNVTVKIILGSKIICQCDNGLEIIVPLNEVSWYETTDPEKLIGTSHDVVVEERIDQDRNLTASIRKHTENPWPALHKKYPKGTRLTSKVLDVRKDRVTVELEKDVTGYINSDLMVKAGHEYENFETNVVPGQGLDVIVTKIFVNRGKIRLDLQRNHPND